MNTDPLLLLTKYWCYIRMNSKKNISPSTVIPTPEIPKNISINASEDAFDTWKVRVRWAPPRRDPDQYNVTLRTHIVETVVVAGVSRYKQLDAFRPYLNLVESMGRKSLQGRK